MADMESFQKMHGLNNEALKKIYKQFTQSGHRQERHGGHQRVLRLLRVERSPFVERLFSMFDSDKTNTDRSQGVRRGSVQRRDRRAQREQG